MPDLHDLFDDSVGAAPPFDLAALARRRRRHRQRQVGALASVVVVLAAIGTAFAVDQPGDRGVVVKTHDGPTSSEVAATTTTAPTTTGNVSTSEAPVVTSTTAAPAPRTPRVDDFTGSLTVTPTTVTVGDAGAAFVLSIHNASGVPLDLSESDDGPRWRSTHVSVVCSPLDGSGDPLELAGQINEFPLRGTALAPGADATLTGTYRPPAGDVGTVLCQGGLVGVPVAWNWPGFEGAFTQIPSVAITVLPQPGSTTTTTTSTTIPASTTVPTS